MATDWVKFAAMRIVKIVSIILLSVFILICAVGLFSNKHIKIWFIEFNGQNEIDKPKENPITVKSDTLYRPIVNPHNNNQTKKTTPSKPQNIQNIDSGGSGIQNNAPNYGIQSGRDTYVSNERQFTKEDENALISELETLKAKSPSNNCVLLFLEQTSNGGKFLGQMEIFLISKGYQIKGRGNQMGQPFYGVKFGVIDSCINIIVGTL